MSEIYYKKGKQRKALKALKKAYKYGLSKEFTFHNLYLSDSVIITKYYKKYNAKYFNTLKDTSVKRVYYEITERDQKIRNQEDEINDKDLFISKMEKVDSLNISILDSLANLYGWAGINVTGGGFYKGEIIKPDLAIVHSDEKINEKYLKLIVESCSEGNELWYPAVTVMKNLLFRFYDKNDYYYVKLRHLKFDKNKNLKKKENYTLLTIYSLYKTIYDNKRRITLHATKNADIIHSEKQLKQIKKALMDFGVPDRFISISNERIDIDNKDDISKNYEFVFNF
jgi:hypothetical protein